MPPPGYGQVATLLNAARGTMPAPIPGRDAAVFNIAATIRLAPGPSPAPTGVTRRRISKVFTLKALAIAQPAIALTAGSAAAATGSLPGPAQSAVSHGLSHVGISVPSGTAVGPDAIGPAKTGLCTAYEAALTHGQAFDHSVAFANLAKAAGGPPTSIPGGSPSSIPAGPPTSIPGGPPTSVPVGPPTSIPGGPPSSIPAGPPTPHPGASHAR